MTGLKNLASIDKRVNDIRVYYTNSRIIRNKIDLLRGLAAAKNTFFFILYPWRR